MGLKQLFKPVKSLEAEEAKQFMTENKEGTYTLLDVRQQGEYEEEHIPGARLIPLPSLHDSVKELDPGKPVIVYCAIGGRSRVAVQLLSGFGFKKIYNLKGGIKAWHGVKAAGPNELNLDTITGDESPSEIIMVAYAMEQALQAFYRKAKEKTVDAGLGRLLMKLIGIEEKHKKTLYELFIKTEPAEKNVKAFEDAVSGSKVMEGGFDIDEFMEQNSPFLDSLRDLAGLAMMLETQSLDLYLRFAEKSRNPETKEVLFKIAEEEKGHLAALGNLF